MPPTSPTGRLSSGSVLFSGSPTPQQSQKQQQPRSPEATALRWLETSATRAKQNHAPERRGLRHYHQAHQEILTVRVCVSWIGC
jgi:hypothetical protein